MNIQTRAKLFTAHLMIMTDCVYICMFTSIYIYIYIYIYTAPLTRKGLGTAQNISVVRLRVTSCGYTSNVFINHDFDLLFACEKRCCECNAVLHAFEL